MTEEENKLRMRPAGESKQIQRLVKAGWQLHLEGADGLGRWVHPTKGLSLIHSIATENDGENWAHISVARKDGKLPDWFTIRDAVWLIYPGEYAVIVVAPETKHVNLREVIHAWVCLTKRIIPDFTRGTGSI